MKKNLVMFALWAMVFGANAQAIKVSNDGKISFGTVETISGWGYSYLQWESHNLVMGTPPGKYTYNSIDLKPGGATQGTLYSQIRIYTSPGFNQHVLRIQINSDGNTYFNNPGNFGIGTSNPVYKLHVYGSTYINGTAICRDGFWLGSDISLKSNILPIDNALTKVKNLEGKKYSLINVTSDDVNSNIQYGFIAQDVEKLIPELVRKKTDSLEFLAINYDGFIPILVEAIKEQQNIIEKSQQKAEIRDSIMNKLQQEVETLRNALITCCNNKIQKSLQEFNLTDPSDANTEEMKVYQNAPNPFNESTLIRCHIPKTIQKAELCVYDIQSSRLKCITVTERGTSTIQIQAGQLAAGIYTYLLIGDGKTSDAKQMILTK